MKQERIEDRNINLENQVCFWIFLRQDHRSGHKDHRIWIWDARDMDETMLQCVNAKQEQRLPNFLEAKL